MLGEPLEPSGRGVASSQWIVASFAMSTRGASLKPEANARASSAITVPAARLGAAMTGVLKPAPPYISAATACCGAATSTTSMPPPAA